MSKSIAEIVRHPARAAIVLAMTAAVLLLLVSGSGAVTLGGFEIDADDESPVDSPLYSGTGPSAQPAPFPAGDDWAQGTSQNGAFKPTGDVADLLAGNCYGSNIYENPAISGNPSIVCDGNSDSKFTATEPELNVVSPAGKTQDEVWPITPGNNPAKDDFSHAYFLFDNRDSICDAGTDADNSFFYMAGHRGDNEGDAFWGFELNQVPPNNFDKLLGNTGETFDLEFQHDADPGPGVDLQPGRTGDGPGTGADDLLISFSLTGGGKVAILQVYRWNSSNTSATPFGTYEEILPSSGGISCPQSPSTPLGDTALQTNGLLPDGDDKGPGDDEHPIEAPPWNVPACDPTPSNSSGYGVVGDGGKNTCRLALGQSGGGTGFHLLPTSDFAEASVDLGAFGITEICFNSMIFTSRSSSRRRREPEQSTPRRWSISARVTGWR